MRRTMVLAAVALVAVVAVAGLLLVGQLRGDRVRLMVQARLTELLGQPVTIEELGFSVSAVTGTGVRIGKGDILAPALDVERIVVRPRLAALVRGNLHIEDVELDGFVVSVLRESGGRWHVPAVGPAPAKDEGSGTAIDRVTVSDGRIRVFDGTPGGAMTESAAIDDIETTIHPDAEGLRLTPITGRIGGAAIGGEARTDRRAVHLEFAAERISDDDLPALLALLGTERPAFMKLGEAGSLTANLEVARDSARLTGTGTLRSPLVLLDAVRLEKFESPFSIDGGRLHFAPATFALHGGTHTGDVTVRFGPTRWTTDSRVTGMHVKSFLEALTGADQRLEGTGTVAAQLNGRVDQPLLQSTSGRMNLVVTNGVIRDFPLLAAIDRALRLTAQRGGDTAFERLSATFDIAGGVARTEDLVIAARDAHVYARGRIGAADRALDLRGAAVLSRERSARAIASVHELSGLRNPQGEIELPLTITGTLDAPSFGIDLKAAIGKGIRDELRRQLQRIIKR